MSTMLGKSGNHSESRNGFESPSDEVPEGSKGNRRVGTCNVRPDCVGITVGACFSQQHAERVRHGIGMSVDSLMSSHVPRSAGGSVRITKFASGTGFCTV